MATWRLTVWCACVTGLVEVALVRGYAGPVRVSTQYPWMAPLSYLLLFGCVAGLVLLAGRLMPRLPTPRAAVFAFGFLGTFSLGYLLPQQIHWAALLLIAGGVAWQASSVLGRHGAVADRIVRRSAPWLLGLIAAMGLWGNVTEAFGERAELSAPPAGAPNVLLLILDTVRAKSLSVYGYDLPTTPSLERFAERGVVFERALASAPWTLPSHATMFTGRLPFEHQASWERPLDATHPTLAEALASRGYATAGFVSNLLYGDREYGLARGFAHYEDYPVSLGQVVLSSALGRAISGASRLRTLLGYHELLNRKDARRITDDFLAWHARREGGRPYFAFLNYFDAHEPYLPPAGYAARFGPARGDADFEHVVTVEQGARAEIRDKWAQTGPQADAERAAYDGAIAYLDEHLGRLFQELEARGELDETIVIVTSDHGEQFGEQGLYGHINSLYLPVLHVPLVIAYPAGAPAGSRIPTPVSLRDLPETVLDLAGLGSGSFPGASLRRTWDERGPVDPEPVPSQLEFTALGEDWYPVASGPGRSLVWGDHHLIEFGSTGPRPRTELFDVAEAFAATENLAGDPEVEPLLSRLRAALDSIVPAP